MAGIYVLLDFQPYLNEPVNVRLLKDIPQSYDRGPAPSSASDAERVVRHAIFDHGTLTLADIAGVMSAKYELLNRRGSLSYEPATAQFTDVGGMPNLRHWLANRKPAFDGSAPELDPPKGVLLLVQGCGKSLAARAAAGIFGVPLVRLDFGALYTKWQGESEKNLRESLKAAEGLAPCVL